VSRRKIKEGKLVSRREIKEGELVSTDSNIHDNSEVS